MALNQKNTQTLENNLFQSKKMKKAQIVTVQSINQGLIRLYTNLRVNFWRRLVL
jgi:hypothetical protein